MTYIHALCPGELKTRDSNQIIVPVEPYDRNPLPYATEKIPIGQAFRTLFGISPDTPYNV